MNVLRNICPDRLGKERNKREYDLRVLNCVSESEYESRMAVWNSLTLGANSSASETKAFIDEVFKKLQRDLKDTDRELSINAAEFIATAHEEINYIKVFVADKTSQYGWYATIVLMIIGIFALCI
ncbi:thiamine-phosphate diphosphorylase [Vibrio artabrorum]|uniref:Thiamine-phosphate diphosphorylase n=1 Tax=Vibrio artabrorum TaxID=446374 RepID=A0ABT8CKD2_9VIBR|nr:thiamine-phosphate diphosphorylase [Vibrio artabrorum]MDN3701913.1 thiamine-phosphate diphosphorylase [Vibrio artabrorum]